MNVAMAYHKGDREQVIRWMEWVRELGGLGEHKLFTIAAFDCEPVPDILPNTSIPDSEMITCDWQSASPARSAASPNSMIRIFAWHFHFAKLGPWLFCEPDAIPLKPGWLDALEAEYGRCGKPFLGARVFIERVPEHLTGVSVYPQDVPMLAPTLIMRTNWISEGKEYELAFDIAGAKEILPQASFTNLIQHNFRHPGFKSQAQVNATIDTAAVLFHSNKSGNLIPFLRQKLKGGDAPCPIPSIAVATDANKLEPSRASDGASEVPPFAAPVSSDTHECLTRDTVAILKQLCRSPVHTGKVRKELKLQGITK